MPRLTHKLPSYRLHRASGQAVIALTGRDYYLGAFNSPESRKEYDRLIQEFLANSRCPGVVRSQAKQSQQSVTINELITTYWDFALGYYVKNCQPTRELQALKYSFKPMAELYGMISVDNFGPTALKAVRQRMVDQGLCRSLVNRRVNRIRRIFKWGVENELVRSTTLEALRAIAPLKRGRCSVRESDPVKPVPEMLVNAIEPFVSRQVWAMIQLQLLTAMRPGEVIQMRRRDIDTSGTVWIYRPESHKTEHHGHERCIYLGPQAQKFVMPFLNRQADEYLFSPLEADKERRDKLSASRKTPLSCGNRPGTHRASKPQRKPGTCYDVDSYRRAISYGTNSAFPWLNLAGRAMNQLSSEERLELKAWRKAHHWHPHQLRHNAATHLRKEFGIEAARLILGHRSVAVTEIYAELDHQKAADIIAKVG
ncbi:MAG: site-specific integrase [Phycisphaerae bacterium]